MMRVENFYTEKTKIYIFYINYMPLEKNTISKKQFISIIKKMNRKLKINEILCKLRSQKVY